MSILHGGGEGGAEARKASLAPPRPPPPESTGGGRGCTARGGGRGGAAPSLGTAAPRGACGHGGGRGQQPLRLHLGPAEAGQGRGGAVMDPPVRRPRDCRRGSPAAACRCGSGTAPPGHPCRSGEAAAAGLACRWECAWRAESVPALNFFGGQLNWSLELMYFGGSRQILVAAGFRGRRRKKLKAKMRSVTQPGTVSHLALLQPSALCVTVCPSADLWMWCANAGCPHGSLLPGAFSVTQRWIGCGQCWSEMIESLQIL